MKKIAVTADFHGVPKNVTPGELTDLLYKLFAIAKGSNLLTSAEMEFVNEVRVERVRDARWVN